MGRERRYKSSGGYFPQDTDFFSEVQRSGMIPFRARYLDAMRERLVWAEAKGSGLREKRPLLAAEGFESGAKIGVSLPYIRLRNETHVFVFECGRHRFADQSVVGFAF